MNTQRSLTISCASKSKLPYENESDNHMYIDVWSPFDKVLHHFSNDDCMFNEYNKPFELIGTCVATSETNPKLSNEEFAKKKENWSVTFDFFNNQREEQKSKTFTVTTDSSSTLFLSMRIYSKQPSFLDFDNKSNVSTYTIQHIGDICLLKSDFDFNKVQVNKFVYLPSEMRNLTEVQRKERIHMSFVFNINENIFQTQMKMFKEEAIGIESKLGYIYTNNIEREMNLVKGDDLQPISPISIPPVGIPCKELYGETLDINRCKGSLPQAYWRHRRNIVSDRWIMKRLEESLLIRGKTKEDFFKFFSNFKSNQYDIENNEFRHYTTDVIRISTIHAATRPYIPDCKWSRENDFFNVDDYNIASTIPGDCEDGAGLALSILWCLIMKTWIIERNVYDVEDMSDEEVFILNTIPGIITFIGIPFGVGGKGKDPYVDNSIQCGHSFGIIVPFNLFLQWRNPKGEEENEKILKNFEKKNDFSIEKRLKHVGVLETTALSSVFYHNRADGGRKQSLIDILQYCITNGLKETKNERQDDGKTLIWKNYHIQEALSENHLMHSEFYRLYCPILNEFYLRNKDADGVDISINHTFTLLQKKQNDKTYKRGVDGIDMFNGHHDNTGNETKIIATIPVIITKDVYDAQVYLTFNFERPTVPLFRKKNDAFDFFRFDNRDSESQYNQLITGSGNPNDTIDLINKSEINKNDASNRVTLFFWKLNKQEIIDIRNMFIKKVREEIGKNYNVSTHCTCFSNGFCMIFSLTLSQ